MRRLPALVVLGTLLASLQAAPALALSWPPDGYPDPPYFCLSQTKGLYRYIETNDPQVSTNPEQDTFFGYATNPGWDNWYGYWEGDLNGKPGTVTGWMELFDHLRLGDSGHWNFSTYGWTVYGRIRQFIAYWNPYFNGQCGWRGGPPPYMADEWGVPVADFAVDNQPPTNPNPYISGFSTDSVSFSWQTVVDQGSGSGADYFASGFDHFVAWLTVNGGQARGWGTPVTPQVLTVNGLQAGDVACLHVIALDKLYNATPEQQACAGPATAPPAPPAPAAGAVAGNPLPAGLAGLPSWFWLTPAPTSTTVEENYAGRRYRIVIAPISVGWSFGDGSSLVADAGAAYPAQSDVQHEYETATSAGYVLGAAVNWSYSWYVRSGDSWLGPYPLPLRTSAAEPLTYPVEQAQPELGVPP